MAKVGRPKKRGRKSLGAGRRKLAKEINDLSTRLKRRLSKIEARGLSSYASRQAGLIDTSVKGLDIKQLTHLRRKLKQSLGSDSTSVRGSKNIQGKIDRYSKLLGTKIDVGKYPQSYEANKKRYNKISDLISSAIGTYAILRTDQFKYGMDEIRTALIETKRRPRTSTIFNMIDTLKGVTSLNPQRGGELVGIIIDIIRNGSNSRYKYDNSKKIFIDKTNKNNKFGEWDMELDLKNKTKIK